VHNLKSLEVLAEILSDMDDSPPVRANRSILGVPNTTLPARPTMTDRGELVVNVGPVVRGTQKARRYSRERYAAGN
jgi:hypothetical protein